MQERKAATVNIVRTSLVLVLIGLCAWCRYLVCKGGGCKSDLVVFCGLVAWADAERGAGARGFGKTGFVKVVRLSCHVLFLKMEMVATFGTLNMWAF